MAQIKVLNRVSNFISDTIIEIYEEAFSLSERRLSNKLNDFWKSNSRLTYNLIFENSEEIGFIFHWNIENFIFIEHFAINTNFRDKGIGKEIFSEWILQNQAATYILEVEPPINQLNERRIKFYESFGFHMLNLDYHQPPYHKKYSPVRMCLMVKSETDITHQIEWYRDQIYKTVYNLNEI